MTGFDQSESRSVSLRNLFPEACLLPQSDILCHRCQSDALACQPGDVLVVGLDELPADEAALRGMAAGVSAVVTEQLLPIPVPQCIVPDTRRAYAQMVSALAEDPTAGLLTLGVAGGIGKTTASLLVASLLKKVGLRVAYNCDLGSSDGVVQSVGANDIVQESQ